MLAAVAAACVVSVQAVLRNSGHGSGTMKLSVSEHTKWWSTCSCKSVARHEAHSALCSPLQAGCLALGDRKLNKMGAKHSQTHCDTSTSTADVGSHAHALRSYRTPPRCPFWDGI